MVDHIHILGASGSGTSTLGKAIAGAFGHRHLDTDDYFWTPSEPPYQQAREGPERQALLGAALDANSRWVLSGSLCGWGDIFIPRFGLVIFLLVPPEIRLARLEERERRRYGEEALAAGGAMFETHKTFMDWAAAYDEGDAEMRSWRCHEQWLVGLSCPCVRFEGDIGVEEN